MAFHISDLWTWRGTVGRGKYLGLGIALFAFKHLLDRLIASVGFGLPWSLFNYWVAGESATEIDNTSLNVLQFYATMVAVALPFIWVGVVLTLRRLRDIGWPLWLVAFFFFPFINLLFFLVLGIVPSRNADGTHPETEGAFVAMMDRIIPKSGVGSAFAAVIVTSALAVIATALIAQGLGNYGWGLFVGLPFFLGLSSVLIYGYHDERSFGKCIAISLLSVVLASAALIAVAVEGIVCIIMAAPLGAVVAMFGGAMGYVIQRGAHTEVTSGTKLRAVSILAIALPVLMVAEWAESREPSLREVRTSVTIAAPPEKVWDKLVAFGELDPPEELLFKTGIAYPIFAEIDVRGVGAVRRCVFSTGAFVEPIEVWDEPRLLKFGVSAQPPIMDEMSPYTTLRPPHLNNYLQSRRGQFLLTRLPNGETLLEGTTWYQNSFWPAAYWGKWSDEIIHRIHQRVLDHIKKQAEQ
jgi:uncharacterized membrane protein YhaH (DUF805 family)